MTRTLSCRTVRLWLQAPSELATPDLDRLQAHLGACDRCDAYHRDAVRAAVVINASLAATAQGLSVRAAVRARLTQPYTAPPRFGGIRWGRPRRGMWLPAVPVALALAVLLLAFLLPQSSGERPGGSRAVAATWKPIRTDISFPLTVDPTRPDHLLAGALGRVYESWDGGTRWRPLASIGRAQVIRDLAIDAANPRHFLVATMHSILASYDAGHHWTTVASNLLGAMNMFLLQDPRSPSTFYVGPSTLWKSTDGGRTWRSAGRGSIFSPWGIQSLALGPRGRLYTGVWGNGVGVSTDGGATWRRRSRGLALRVMTVSAGPGRLLAATDSGVYRSTNGGARWRRSGPWTPFFTTSVYDGGTFQLAGGNGGVFRSTDGGRHWSVAVAGLPLYSYVYGFVGDPRHPGRVYASLDNDGIFRSDDGGLHWRPVNAGLPIGGRPLSNSGIPPLVLFARQGALWRTDAWGTDPGTLTVDAAVREAAVSPDSAAVAYITGAPGGWSLRVVGAGGSAARTLLTGSGGMPDQIVWSPDSARIAVLQGPLIRVAGVDRRVTTWSAPRGERFLAWSRDGSALRFWSVASHTVLVHDWRTGRTVARQAGTYATSPLVSPDGQGLALLAHGIVKFGAWSRPPVRVARLPARCVLRAWADTGAAVLASCPGGVAIVRVTGRMVLGPRLPADAEWAPGSDDTLLFFRRGALWRWTARTGARAIVKAASPAFSYRPGWPGAH